MARFPATNDLDERLDFLGQLPLLKIYTQISLCFPVPDESSRPAIINTLTKGLERLTAGFPWVAGQVVNSGSNEGNPDILKITALDPLPRLVVKDLRDDPSMPTMSALRQANFPFRMLDENVIAPRNTLPGGPNEEKSPVFLLQANFLTGGLVLTIVGAHPAMDMTGQGQLIDLLSKACRGEEFTSEELKFGNLPRHDLVPLLDDDYTPGPEVEHQIVKPATSDPPSTTAPPANCSWKYFTFPAASLTAIKSLAAESTTLPPGGFISTDDALSAFIWQSIIRARLPRLDPIATTTLCRAVDVRHAFNLPDTYAGLMQNINYHPYTIADLVSLPLGVVASGLRLALDPAQLAYRTRALATVLTRSADKSIVSFAAKVDSSTDLMMSSWSKLDCYELDFGLGLGKPECVRRPQFTPYECLSYLMPKRRDGEVTYGVSLRDEDMERLRGDEEFKKFATFIE